MADFGPPPPFTRDQLIAVLERNFEAHWIEALLDDPTSLSAFEGMVAAILRVMESSDENFSEGAHILTAPGRSPAASVVRLTRPNGGSAVTIGTSQRFIDDRGQVWVPSAPFDVPASGGSQTVDVPIRTLRSGYWLNSFEPLTYQILDDLPDSSFRVDPGPDPATGGSTPFLDQHGKERLVFRAEGETDAEYRNRIRFLEDQVSPKAIADTIVEVLDAFPSTAPIAALIVRDGLRTLMEPFRDTAQESQRNLTGLPGPLFFDSVQPIPVASPVPDPGAAFFDDPAGGFIRDLLDFCGWFDVFLPTPVDPDEARIFYDDPDPEAGSFYDDPEVAYYVGPAPGEGIAAPLAALADELDRRRAACVGVRILLGEDVLLIRSPPLFSLSQTDSQAGDWTDQDGSATDQDMTEAVESFDGDDSYVISSTGTGGGSALAAGDLVYVLPAVTAPQAINRVILRARARAEDVGAGVDPELAFIIQPSTAAAPIRVTASTFTVASGDWTEFVAVLEENPDTASAWTLSDIAGVFGFGAANIAAVGATEELRVSELLLVFDVDHG